jgi:hypothetical protein
MGGGARQPGMTGQVKEEILARMGELGVSVRYGALCFEPTLLRREEFLRESSVFSYIDAAGKLRELSLSAGSLAFTVCQTPVVYVLGESAAIDVKYSEGPAVTLKQNCLDHVTTRHVFDRDGQVEMLQVCIER